MKLTPPELAPFCQMSVELGPPREMGDGRSGRRRIIPITGGSVTGSHLSGRILDLGADWQTIFRDGVAEIDTRYAFETADGALIEVINQGYRHGPPEVIQRLARGEECDPGEYYFRTAARLETGDPRYDWVNRTVFIGTGARFASAVQMDLYQIL